MLLADAQRPYLARHFVAVWTDHPKWARKKNPKAVPRDPAIWEETHAWDPNLILWVVSPDRSFKKGFRYHDYKTPDDLRRALDDAIRESHASKTKKKASKD